MKNITFLICMPFLILLLFTPLQQAQSSDNLLIDKKAAPFLLG